MAAGMVALAIVGVDGALGLVIVTLAIVGVGNGVVYSAATSYALIDVATDDALSGWVRRGASYAATLPAK